MWMRMCIHGVATSFIFTYASIFKCVSMHNTTLMVAKGGRTAGMVTHEPRKKPGSLTFHEILVV